MTNLKDLWKFDICQDHCVKSLCQGHSATMTVWQQIWETHSFGGVCDLNEAELPLDYLWGNRPLSNLGRSWVASLSVIEQVVAKLGAQQAGLWWVSKDATCVTILLCYQLQKYALQQQTMMMKMMGLWLVRLRSWCAAKKLTTMLRGSEDRNLMKLELWSERTEVKRRGENLSYVQNPAIYTLCKLITC